MASVPGYNEEYPVDNMQLRNFRRISLPAESDANDSRNQNCLSTYREIFCPYLRLVSFSTAIAILNINLFIVTLVHSFINGGLDSKNEVFLAPNINTLVTFGAKVS